MTLTVGSLFSGIGGLDLGLERAGMTVIWQSEIDPYASRVLAKHWPEVPNYGDIKLIDWSRVERPSVICGGYPCQPFSTAGNRKGEEDPRHLWPWVRQAISELQPDYAILENVRGHLSLGGTTVIADLAAIGYDAEWRIVSAASVGANHRRDRIIIVAYPNDNGLSPGSFRAGFTTPNGQKPTGQEGSTNPQRCCGIPCDVADTEKFERDERGHREPCDTPTKWDAIQDPTGRGGGNRANTDSVRRLDGRAQVFSTEGRQQALGELAIGRWWETEPDVGRVAHGVPSRVDRLRGLGNAVVPQVAEVIGRLVIAHHEATQ